jgi:hypothetical protein
VSRWLPDRPASHFAPRTLVRISIAKLGKVYRVEINHCRLRGLAGNTLYRIDNTIYGRSLHEN